ncbi:MAG: ATP-dependent DNA helicase [Candidatus Poseidoniaceae archaeon]|jgi:DNA excision repair protein ERCC-2|nr:ATP-dependent DNA helicase [Candidatus Poseidoniaceae archaeon]
MHANEVTHWLAHPIPREGQLDMVTSCIDTMLEGKTHLASAPTGVGKTAAALAAALDIAQKSNERKTIMFVTPRQSQHKIVVDTVRQINDRNPENKLTLVDMIGQSGMCVEPFAGNSGPAFSLMCSQHRKNKQCKPWLTNAPDFIKRILSDPLHVGELVEMSKIHREHGEKLQTCPWKAARTAAKSADIVVCDYNHLFIDEVRTASLKAMELDLQDLIVIVDEGHNLPDRVRMGMKRTLTPTMVRNAATEVEEHLGHIEKSSRINSDAAEALQLKRWNFEVCKELRKVLNREFKNLLGELVDSNELKVDAKDIISWVDEAFDAVAAIVNQSTLTGEGPPFTPPHKDERWYLMKTLLASNEVDVDENGENEPSAHLLADLFDVILRFGNTTALCLVFEGEGRDGRIISHLLDAGLVAGPIFEKTYCAMMMSGTLDPPHMFADLLGIENEKRGESVHPSPFAKERRPIVVATDVTTLWKERGFENTRKIREHIIKLSQSTPGNVAAFVPSYKILEEIFTDLHIPGLKKMTESRKWSKQDIDSLLVELEDSKKIGSRILLAGVFNGKLSEGIDYKGGMLDAVICIGIPNAPPSVYHNALGDYISQKFGSEKKWRYTTIQPSVNSILQAMGRPIRAMGDRALILLLDRRNSERTYKICYPPDTMMNPVSNADSTARFAKRFFSKVKWEES